jgi:glyoxylase-like metal-dependent hydrolase (beta-lactamase superfamily II)
MFEDYLVRNGMDRNMAEEAAAVVRYALSLPEEMVRLQPDEKSPFGESAARIVHAPGHADNQLVLHDEVRGGILFAADHLLLGITPNIGLWPESEPHPLARYLESLEGMLGLGAALVLPGLGPVFHDLDGRIGELISHHE